jgi:predicted transcriptional regulator
MRARIRGKELRTNRTDRRYRSRIEILRDFLGAVRETGKKTHIIGLANLNPTSFQPYLDFCSTLHLVQDTPAGYRLTPRADAVLDVIERLLARSAEVDAALLDLHRGFNGSNLSRPASSGTLRYVSILAWNDIVQSVADSVGTEDKSHWSRRSIDLPDASSPTWLGRAGESDTDEPIVARHFLLDTADPPARRPARTRSRD